MTYWWMNKILFWTFISSSCLPGNLVRRIGPTFITRFTHLLFVVWCVCVIFVYITSTASNDIHFCWNSVFLFNWLMLYMSASPVIRIYRVDWWTGQQRQVLKVLTLRIGSWFFVAGQPSLPFANLFLLSYLFLLHFLQ